MLARAVPRPLTAERKMPGRREQLPWLGRTSEFAGYRASATTRAGSTGRAGGVGC